MDEQDHDYQSDHNSDQYIYYDEQEPACLKIAWPMLPTMLQLAKPGDEFRERVSISEGPGRVGQEVSVVQGC